jgi:acylphosphatase
MAVKRVHLQISGRVQGVFYRGWTEEHARKLGLGGWVRNRFDGSVEAVFEGPRERVEEMVSLCHDGPPHARVDSILDDDSEPVEGLVEFRVLSSV